MNLTRSLLSLLMAVALPGALGASTTLGATSDSLYIGDASDNTIKHFDAQTGASLGVFVPTSAGLVGPRGILHVDRRLLVSNQNVNLKIPGEIDQFSIMDGTSPGALVPSTDPHAPFAPRGIILGPGPAGPGNSTLYVADFGKAKIGRVARFGAVSGHWLGDLDSNSFINNASLNPTGEFRPRGLVFGPDGRLYVTLFSEKFFPSFGWVLRYDLGTGSVSVFTNNGPTASATGCTKHLNAPEGLTFGPDGRLYVATLRTGTADVDRIVILSADTGQCVDEIALDQAGGPRARAHAMVFGPGGSLFVPIDASKPDGTNGPDAGAVRRYDVTSKTFSTFVSPGGPLVTPWYLTFGNTSPRSLAYTD